MSRPRDRHLRFRQIGGFLHRFVTAASEGGTRRRTGRGCAIIDVLNDPEP